MTAGCWMKICMWIQMDWIAWSPNTSCHAHQFCPIKENDYISENIPVPCFCSPSAFERSGSTNEQKIKVLLNKVFTAAFRCSYEFISWCRHLLYKDCQNDALPLQSTPDSRQWYQKVWPKDELWCCLKVLKSNRAITAIVISFTLTENTWPDWAHIWLNTYLSSTPQDVYMFLWPLKNSLIHLNPIQSHTIVSELAIGSLCEWSRTDSTT